MNKDSSAKIRFGLCCLFQAQPINFRQTTAKALGAVPREEQLRRLSEICLHNLRQVAEALAYLQLNGIGAFRVMSPLFPRYTHPQVGYHLQDLPEAAAILQQCSAIRSYQRQHDIRLSLHPDQFNVLSSPHPDVIRNTVRELEYQGELAELLGVELINVHVGGAYGNKVEALARVREHFPLLSERVRTRLTLENDDVSFSPMDVLPLCRDLKIPFVYDVHHHRCLPDAWSEEEASSACAALWRDLGRETYVHLSSPKNGWAARARKPHADFIDPVDFPVAWKDMAVTVDVEAKAKELAVLRLMADLGLAL